MARLPKVGDDKGTWGGILNEFLKQSHDNDGSLKADTVGAVQLKPSAVTSAALAGSSVSATKIADGAVGTTQLADAGVTTQKLAGLGEPDGVASLDSDGRLPEAQVPERLGTAELNAAYAHLNESGELVIGDTVIPMGGVSMLAEAGKMLGKLEKAQTPACLAVLGDSTALGYVPSTGGSLRWVYQTALWLGERYPLYTVRLGMWQNVQITDAAFTSGSTTMASAGSSFTSADIGKTVSGAPTSTILPENTTIVSVTNSTTVVLSNAATSTASAQTMYLGVYEFHTLQTGTYSRSVAGAGTTSGSTALTGPANSFTWGDVGRPISGTGIPAGTVIAGYTSATSVTLSQAATATGSVTVTLGAHVFSVYNGSISGGQPKNNINVLNAQTPQEPDLTIIAHGHNVGPTVVADPFIGIPGLFRKARKRWPLAPVVLVAQNPVTSANVGYDAQLKVRQVISELATKLGTGFIDSASVFLSYPDWEADLIAPDTVHPAQLGYDVWSLSLRPYFTYQREAGVKGPPVLRDRLWVGADKFAPTGSSASSVSYSSGATAGSVAPRIPAVWLFDPDTAAPVGAWIHIPEDWNSWNTYLYAVPVDTVASGGSVVWQIGTYQLDTLLAGEVSNESAVALPGPTDIGNIRTTAFASGDQGRVRRAEWLWSNQPYRGRGWHYLQVQRFANNGSDTLTIRAGLLGIMFERID